MNELFEDMEKWAEENNASSIHFGIPITRQKVMKTLESKGYSNTEAHFVKELK